MEYDPPRVIRVWLDQFHRGLTWWQNELHWYDGQIEAGEFEEDVELVRQRVAR